MLGVGARNVFLKSITWRSTDFLRHVVGETEGRGAIAFMYVLLPIERFLWWVSTYHGERQKKNSISGLVGGAGNLRLEKAESSAHLADWRRIR